MLDWIAAAFELFGMWLIGNKKKVGFLSCMACSIVWIIISFRISLYGLAVAATLCFITHVRNYLKWGKSEQEEIKN